MNKSTKFITAMLLSFLLFFNACQTSEKTVWYVGNPITTDVKAAFNKGTLTISGKGSMIDYSNSYPPPWHSYNLNIVKVVIKNGVTGIGNMAFAGHKELASVIIGNSVASIGNSAFDGCIGLTSIAIGSDVINIKDGAFFGCNGLTNIKVSKNNKNYNSQDGVLFNKNKTKLIEYPTGKKGTYNIPNSVKNIANGAFRDCAGLTHITIPNSVTSIENLAFSGCRGLTSVDIPNSVTSIGNYVFRNCRKLKSVNIPGSVVKMGDGVFSECGELKNIEVSEDNEIYSSENGVFFNKDKTILIKYPTGKKGEYIVPDGVKGIGHFAFYNCSDLTSIIIGSSVEKIGWTAFFGCNGLTSITIPQSVIDIGNSAFDNCNGLTEITSLPDIPPTAKGAFGKLDKTKITLYTPQKSINAYQTARDWEDFSSISKI